MCAGMACIARAMLVVSRSFSAAGISRYSAREKSSSSTGLAEAYSPQCCLLWAVSRCAEARSRWSMNSLPVVDPERFLGSVRWRQLFDMDEQIQAQIARLESD